MKEVPHIPATLENAYFYRIWASLELRIKYCLNAEEFSLNWPDSLLLDFAMFLSALIVFLNFSSLFCRSVLEEVATVELDEEAEADLQIERFNPDVYNMIFTLGNTTVDLNITRKHLDVDVWIADEEGNTSLADYQVVLLLLFRSLFI